MLNLRLKLIGLLFVVNGINMFMLSCLSVILIGRGIVLLVIWIVMLFVVVLKLMLVLLKVMVVLLLL